MARRIQIQEAAAQLKKDLSTTSKAKLRVLSAHLTAADHKASRKTRLHDVVTCAQEVIAAIDIDSLTKYVSINLSPRHAILNLEYSFLWIRQRGTVKSAALLT